MRTSKVLTLLGLFALLGGFVLLQVFAARQASSVQVSTVAPTGTGLSTFLSFAEQLYPSAVTAKRSAVFSSQELRSTGALLILSPEMEISTRESAIIKEFVEDGGLLLISFHNEVSWRALKNLRKELGSSLTTKPFEDFENYKVQRATAPPGIPLFEAGEIYSFYGAHVFDKSTCRGGNFSCFVEHLTIEKGDAIIVSGLPPLANGLLQGEGNQLLAANIIPAVGTIVIDEYRHFFSDKTLSDLLTKPSFIVPMLALLLGAIGFFIFGYSEPAHLRDRSRQVEERPAFHDFSLHALRGLVAGEEGLRGVVELHQRALYTRFPLAANQIKAEMRAYATKPPLQLAAALLKKHRALLELRTGIRPSSAAGLPPPETHSTAAHSTAAHSTAAHSIAAQSNQALETK